MCEQLEGIVRLGANHFEPDAEQIAAQACDELRAIRDSRKTSPSRWSIPLSRPIRTTATNSYQPGDKGGLATRASLSFVWEIEGTEKRDEFALVGLCSTKIVLSDTSDKLGGVTTPLAWTFEMGSKDSPGCHFHTQIDWKAAISVALSEEDMQNWPSLDVPRLPSLFLTPGDCLDFVLGELFQDRWPKQYEETAPAEIGRWVSSSRQRLLAVLKSSIQAAERDTRISPWLAIKRWYPQDTKLLLT